MGLDPDMERKNKKMKIGVAANRTPDLFYINESGDPRAKEALYH